MANTFLTPDIIAKEALMVLENNLVMAGLVHRDYSPEFAKVGDNPQAGKIHCKEFHRADQPPGRRRGQHDRQA